MQRTGLLRRSGKRLDYGAVAAVHCWLLRGLLLCCLLPLQAGAVGVVGYGGVDVEGEREGGAALFAGNSRRNAGADGLKEVLEFEPEGLRAFYRELLQVEANRGVRRGHYSWVRNTHRCGIGNVDGEELLTGEIEGEVLAGLEKAEFSNLLGGDARSGEVSDAAGLELDADVGDIDLGGEDGEADGTELADG